MGRGQAHICQPCKPRPPPTHFSKVFRKKLSRDHHTREFPSGPPRAHEHIPIEALQHDRILRAQVVCRQGAGLPAKALVGIGEILGPRDVCAELRGQGSWPPSSAV